MAGDREHAGQERGKEEVVTRSGRRVCPPRIFLEYYRNWTDRPRDDAGSSASAQRNTHVWNPGTTSTRSGRVSVPPARYEDLARTSGAGCSTGMARGDASPILGNHMPSRRVPGRRSASPPDPSSPSSEEPEHSDQSLDAGARDDDAQDDDFVPGLEEEGRVPSDDSFRDEEWDFDDIVEDQGQHVEEDGVPERRHRDMSVGWQDARNVVQHYLGPMDHVCPRCYALKWPGESDKLCCPNARAMQLLQTIFSEPAPQELRDLLATYPKRRDQRIFLQRIRVYNNALSFASTGLTWSNADMQGVRFLEMQGQAYHLIPPLEAGGIGGEIYSQIYIIDGEEEQFHILTLKNVSRRFSENDSTP